MVDMLSNFQNSAFYKFGSGIANWISDTFNSWTGKRADDIAEQNLNMQQQELDYQHQLQQQIFEREDTSYQRTANDMRAAGLSPLSMNGANGAGETIATQAPQRADTSQNVVQNGMNALNMITDTAQNVAQLQIQKAQAQAQINKTVAETTQINQATSDLALRNPITRSILSRQLSDLNFNAIKNSWYWENGDKDIFLDSKASAHTQSSILSRQLSDLNFNANKNSWYWENGLKDIFEDTKASSRSSSEFQKLSLIRAINDFNYMSTFGLADSMTPAERISQYQAFLKNGKPPIPEWYFHAQADKDQPFSYGKFTDTNHKFNPEYLTKVLDKQLLSVWQSLVGTITGAGGSLAGMATGLGSFINGRDSNSIRMFNAIPW